MSPVRLPPKLVEMVTTEGGHLNKTLAFEKNVVLVTDAGARRTVRGTGQDGVGAAQGTRNQLTRREDEKTRIKPEVFHTSVTAKYYRRAQP
jgi:hypothetical protein